MLINLSKVFKILLLTDPTFIYIVFIRSFKTFILNNYTILRRKTNDQKQAIGPYWSRSNRRGS